MTKPAFVFPVIGFWFGETYRGQGKTNRLEFYDDWVLLEQASQGDLEDECLVGMILVDSDGLAATIRSVKRMGCLTSAWKRRLWRLTGRSRHVFYKIDCEFEATGHIAFNDVQRRVCKSLDENGFDFVDEEDLVGEQALDLADHVERMKASVGEARSIQEIYDRLVALGL